jgi:hypothetical protein
LHSSPERRRIAAAAALLTAVALAACNAPPAPGPLPAPASPFLTTLSVHDVMVSVVDPAADALWESVGSVSTKAGTEEHRPSTDEEWEALRRHAVRLAESANLLLIEGRAVVAPGRQLDDAGVAGVLDAEGVQKAIAANQPGFVQAAHRLHAAASQALAAVDRRDAAGLDVAGAVIDKACESCHLVYWYPNARQPPGPTALAPATGTPRP